MDSLIHVFHHTVGACGEGHIKIFDVVPYVYHLTDVFNTYRVYVSKSILTQILIN